MSALLAESTLPSIVTSMNSQCAQSELPNLKAIVVSLSSTSRIPSRQTITAYPHGDGSYTVANTSLVLLLGLLAAFALMIDYVLVVAIRISAGVGAVVSAVQVLQPNT
jgi:hypothetical protein